jgi:uncharacterized protein YqjF (DUF2071 family)
MRQAIAFLVRSPGIWFFTLETDRLLAALGGRLAYG